MPPSFLPTQRPQKSQRPTSFHLSRSGKSIEFGTKPSVFKSECTSGEFCHLEQVLGILWSKFFHLLKMFSFIKSSPRPGSVFGKVNENPLAWFIQVFIPDFLQEAFLDLLPSLVPLF